MHTCRQIVLRDPPTEFGQFIVRDVVELAASQAVLDYCLIEVIYTVAVKAKVVYCHSGSCGQSEQAFLTPAYPQYDSK
jgi:hypothetical protein